MTDRPDGAPEAASDTPEGAAPGDPLSEDTGIEGQTEATEGDQRTDGGRRATNNGRATCERKEGHRICCGCNGSGWCGGSRRPEQVRLRPRARRGGAAARPHLLPQERRPRPK